MNFTVAGRCGDATILSTHSRGKDDGTALQLIRADLLAYYRSIEAEYLRLLESLVTVSDNPGAAAKGNKEIDVKWKSACDRIEATSMSEQTTMAITDEMRQAGRDAYLGSLDSNCPPITSA
jgi:hypothetical protein